jgi:hypothetical protein
VYFDGQRLIVTDQGNHRVLIWNGWPTNTAQAADVVVGQPNFSVNNANNGASGPVAPGLQFPTGAIASGESLFVADAGNLRVLVYTPIPTTNGASPAAVLGQDDFVSELEATNDKRFGAHAGNGFGATLRLAAGSSSLWVADQANHRVLRFELDN